MELTQPVAAAIDIGADLVEQVVHQLLTEESSPWIPATHTHPQHVTLETEERREGRSVRVRSLVQGVGFRPTVWRLAQDCGIAGEVWNDAEGVMI